jgi:hypothetical protein
VKHGEVQVAEKKRVNERKWILKQQRKNEESTDKLFTDTAEQSSDT